MTLRVGAENRSAGKPHACGSARRKRALVLAVSLGILGLGGCARSASTTISTATATATATAAPTVAPTDIATPVAQPAVTKSGAAVATKPAITANAPAIATPRATSGALASASPVQVALTGTQILSVDAKPAVVHAGGTVAWLVLTTDDVTSVVARVAAYSLPLQRVGPGRFALNFSIPANVPGFFHGRYDLTVHAQNASGASAERLVSLKFE